MQQTILTTLSVEELREIIGSEFKKQFNSLQPGNSNLDIIDIDEAMKLTGYTRSTIYTKVSRNEIPFIKQGGSLRFDKAELINWIRGGKNITQADIDRFSNDYLTRNS